METVYLGLGGNSGQVAATLKGAVRDLGAALEGVRVSSLYRSAARYYEAQPDFLNAVVEGRTALSPRELLAFVNSVEARWGRDRSREISKGPRSLDIDILLYGSRIVAEDGLVIPHPGLVERKFALLPLVELAPGLVDPVSGDRYLDILASLPPQGIYLDAGPDYDRLYL